VSGVRLRIAVLLEILAIFVGGLLTARWVTQSLGLRSSKEYIATLPAHAMPDLLRLAPEVAAGQLIRYGILLLLAFVVGYWRAGHKLREYGITLAGPWRDHLQNGIAATALIAIPAELIQLASTRFFAEDRPAAWRLIDRVPWDWKFWLYMAISSYLLMPIVEELTFRGWMQTRLTSTFGSASAIVLTAVVFTVSHTQYIGANVLSAALLIGTLFGAVVSGVLRDISGSLAPPILAHALLNVPTRGAGSLAVIAVSLAVIIVLRGRVAELLRHAVAAFQKVRWIELAWSAAVIVAIAAVVLAFRRYAMMIAAVAAIVSVLLYNAPPQRNRE
jgi:membrane protease YdiL (CAAX protease family)